MKKRFGAMPPGRILLICGSICLYVLALAILLTLKFREDDQRQEEIFGSMEGRFRSDITMEYEGQTLYYRENEITNYLLIGLDHDHVRQITGYQNGGQADFMVLLSIDRVNRSVTPVMLDRDTMTPVQTYGVFGHPSGTQVMQLCLAQAYSGLESSGSDNTVQAVTDLLCGIKIDHHITMDVAAIPLLNDAIGGVEVTLEDDFTVYDPAMIQGSTLRLFGDQAEFFVRGRMTVADGTNASRMRRQQQYISAFLTQLRQEMEADPDKISGLLDTVSGHMITDASRETLLADADAYENYRWQPMQTLSGTHALDEYRFAEFWPDAGALQSMAADLWFMKEERK